MAWWGAEWLVVGWWLVGCVVRRVWLGDEEGSARSGEEGGWVS